MKRYSSSFAIQEIQIKTTTRCRGTPVRMPKIKMVTTPDVGKDAKQMDPLFIVDGNFK